MHSSRDLFDLQKRNRISRLILPCILILNSSFASSSFFHRNNNSNRRILAPAFRKMSSIGTAKRDSPSAQRNKEPIFEFLSSKALPSLVNNKEFPIRVLEIAAGCGVHTDHFAGMMAKDEKLQSFLWLPTDPDESSRASIQCYIEDGQLGNYVDPPKQLTLNEKGIIEEDTESLLRDPLDLIICINMIHISNWEATLGLMKVAGEKLSKKGYLYCYGPYKIGGTAVESNLNFDRSLKSRDPKWGVRDLEKVCKAAEEQGLHLVKKAEMPANNLSLLFQKKSIE